MRRKTYSTLEEGELKADVVELEHWLSSTGDDITCDDAYSDMADMMRHLDLSERRLLMVYALLDQSIIATARYFSVDRKTVALRITEIKSKIKYT